MASSNFWNDKMIEALILKVKTYNVLYDYNLDEFKDVEIKNNAFREIGLQLGVGNCDRTVWCMCRSIILI